MVAVEPQGKSVEEPQASELVSFLLLTGTMKNLPRTGWRLVGIKDCESVADHGFRVVLIALLLGELVEGVEQDKLLQMAVLHELPESVVTDLPLVTRQLFGREVKYRAEKEAWSRLLPPGPILETWRALWEEFEAGQSLEAKLVRVADKLEMVLQAYEYQLAGHGNLEAFWDRGNLEDYGLRPIRALFEELVQRREALDSD